MTPVLRGDNNPPVPMWLGWVMLITSVIGCVASSIILDDHIALLENPDQTFFCDLGGAFSCSTVMAAPEAKSLGISNPYLGIMGFGGMLGVAFTILSRSRFAPWFWALISLGISLVVAFCHFLAWSAIFRIEALCINCMAIWTVSIILFCATLAYVLPTFGGDNWISRSFKRWWWAIAFLWIAAIGAVIYVHFYL
ncbi:Vitamin K epoxide reductase family protein [Corynebacterium caspium DSM 44850]|nr:Vitamin K epoxide reductase family protein [Corynebacterium caspium DSM 44850]